MPVRMHERHQASRGGLNGSGGSGRPLLAFRDKARGRSVKARKDCRRRLRFGKSRVFADEPGGAARRGTKVALVRGAGVVVPAAIRLTMGVMHHGRWVLMAVVRGARLFMPVVRAVLTQLGFSLDSRSRPGARHGGRKRSPNGKKHCKQQEQPGTKQLHGDWIMPGRKVAGRNFGSMNLAPMARSSGSPKRKSLTFPSWKGR